MHTHNREEGAMKSYAGIDLHGTNSVIVVLDDDDRVTLTSSDSATSWQGSSRPSLPSVRRCRALPWSPPIIGTGSWMA